MKFTSRVKNAFSAFNGKQQNNVGTDAADFLRYGNRSNPTMRQDWSQVEMSDQDMYTGYSYAAINKRANRAAVLGKNFLYTKAAQAVMDAAKSKEQDVTHPYLPLISESKEFSENEFWREISTYLDLEGIYYLMAVRAIGVNSKGETYVGAIQKFVLMNPYEVRRVKKEATGELGGYIESKDGLIREIPKELVIEIRLLNPFKKDIPYSMTDAAKENQFTMKQAGDYTRHSIKGNINSPGAITTDVVLEDHIFDNFVSRIQNHSKGEPLYGNGSGAINWQSMQIDLDKAALDKINEIHRSTLFAVSGTSKTMMGIEESGTGREVSKTQKDDFTENTVMPQIENIIDALNLDYRRWYPEWEKNKYEIALDNPLESDREAELKDIEIREKEYEMTNKLMSLGYEYELAAKYAHGEISLQELGEPTLEEELSPEEAERIAMRELGMDAPKIDSEPDEDTEVEGLNSLSDKSEVFSVKAVNKMVTPAENEERIKVAADRLKKRLKAEEELAKAQKAKDKKAEEKAKKEFDKAVEQDKPKGGTKKGPEPKTVDVPAPKKTEGKSENAVGEIAKAVNQIAARDYPELYEGMDIDFNSLGCIMMDTEKIPVAQYIKNPDEDLFEKEGWGGGLAGEDSAHVTLLYGLLENGNIWKDKVDMLLKGWELPSVTIEEVSYFDLGDSYAIIGLVEKTPELVDGHERLTLLPHINTFSEYHPHITLAYIKHDVDPQKWIKPLAKKYNGQKVATRGINYGDLPEDDDSSSNNDADGKTSNELEAQQAVLTPVAALTSHDCSEHEHSINSTLEKAVNALDSEAQSILESQERSLQNAVAKLEGDVAAKVIEALRRGDIKEAEELIAEAQDESILGELVLTFAAFYTALFPIYAAQLFAARLAQFGVQGVFAMSEEVKAYINEAARKAAESHLRTVAKDFANAWQDANDEAVRKAVTDELTERMQKQEDTVLALLPENPNREDVEKAVDAGKFDADPAYSRARELVREGHGLDQIVRALQSEYQNMTKTRAKTIARHESNRVFNMSQYEADLQFLTESGLMSKAYKRLRNRANDPCAVCAMLITSSNANPIPFSENFADLGDELTATYTKANGKMAVQKVPISYEAIKAGNVHVNCRCEYELVIKQDDGSFLNDIDFRVTNAKGDGYNPYRDSRGRFDDGPNFVAIPKMRKKATFLRDAFEDNGAKNFADEIEIADYTQKYFNGMPERNQYDAMNAWVGAGGCREIQEHIRNDSDSEYIQELVEGLDEATQTSELKDDLNLYRGMAMTMTQLLNLQQSEKFSVKTFFTTGINSKRVEEHFAGYGSGYDEELKDFKKPVLFRIKAPKGTKGAFMDARYPTVEFHNGLGEFVPARDNLYNVLKVEVETNGEGGFIGAIVDMEIVK